MPKIFHEWIKQWIKLNAENVKTPAQKNSVLVDRLSV
jgi:hypothetical protein